MPIISKLAVAAFCAIGGLTILPAAAFADIENGLYSGTIDGGTTLNFTVAADPNNSAQHVVTSYGWNFNDSCKGGATLSGGWSTGFGANGAPIKNGKITIINSYAYYYVNLVIKLASGGTATGTIATADPTLAPLNGTKKPKKAVYCSSPAKSFTATINIPANTPLQGTMPLANFTLKQ